MGLACAATAHSRGREGGAFLVGETSNWGRPLPTRV